jgi:membrane protein YqaA with SNARE-associated domain
VHFLQRLYQYLLVLGIPGLFAIALLDSAALPLVGGPDGVVVLLSWQQPGQAPWIVLAASLGSMLGCLILYRIARAGGDRVLARTSPKRQAWVKRQVENQGFFAVFLAVIVPPPFPTKPIILAAGIFRTPLVAFSLAVFFGRLIRYSAMAWLGARFGDQAAQVIKSHYAWILIFLAGFTLLFLLARRYVFPITRQVDK